MEEGEKKDERDDIERWNRWNTKILFHEIKRRRLIQDWNIRLQLDYVGVKVLFFYFLFLCWDEKNGEWEEETDEMRKGGGGGQR